MKLTEQYIKKPTLTHLSTALILIIGLLVLSQINQTLYPKVNFDIMVITTTYPGASAEDVEVKVTNPIEDELKEVEGIDYTRSFSLENVSLVYVWIDLNVSDTEEVKDNVRRAIDRVSDLPPEIDEKPKIDEMKSGNIPIMEVAITGDESHEASLRKLARNLEDDLLEIKGVASANKEGYREREIKILPQLDKLNQYQLSIEDIIKSISEQNLRISAGDTSSRKNAVKVVTYSEFDNIQDIENLILRANIGGSEVRLKDVATIQNGFEDFIIEARTNGKFSINLMVRSQYEGNIEEISQKVKTLVKNYQVQELNHAEIIIVRDFSKYTERLLGIVKNNAIIGFIMVLVCLFIFLTPMTAFWTAIGIPLSILGASIFFPWFDIEINFITLITMILVLGLLVDDAIVVAENITRYREKGIHPFEAAILATKEVFWPVFTTILTSIVAFSSMLFMKGVTGKFVHQIPIVVMLTLLFSLLEATIILPAHIALSKKDKPRQLKWFENLKRLYERSLRYALKKWGMTIAGFSLFLVLNVFLFLKMPFILFPYDDVDIFYVLAELPPETSHDQTKEEMKKVEKLIEAIPRNLAENYTTRIGHHDTNVYGASEGLHSNWAMITVYMTQSHTRDTLSEEVMAKLEPELQKLSQFTSIRTEKYNDGPPVGKPITLDLVSDNENLRNQYEELLINELKAIEIEHEDQSGILSQIKPIINIDSDNNLGKKEYLFIPKYENLVKSGISPKQLGTAIRATLDGIVTSTITREGEEIEFRVELSPQDKQDLEQLKQISLRNQHGNLTPLKDLVHLSQKQGIESFKHYNGRRSTRITADVKADFITSAQANQIIRNKFEEKVEQTPNLTLLFGGEEKATQESMESFLVAFILSIFAIYAILVILFNSYIIKPLCVLIAIPFGIGGIIISFFTHGQPISFLGLIGTLGLVGIIVNDSLIMVSYLAAHSKSDNNEPLDELIIKGALTRFRPVLLTTITTVAGLLPTIYGLGGTEPFLIPIVLAVAGGLVFGTAIILILVPLLYSLFHKLNFMIKDNR